jgi:hypothetical protein
MSPATADHGRRNPPHGGMGERIGGCAVILTGQSCGTSAAGTGRADHTVRRSTYNGTVQRYARAKTDGSFPTGRPLPLIP